MPAAILIFVPTLDDALLDGGWMPALRARVSRGRRAELVVSGLNFPQTVQTNVLWGAPPRTHGLSLGIEAPLSPLERALGPACRWVDRAETSTSEGLQLLRRTELCETRLDAPFDVAALRAVAAKLDRELSGVVDGCPDETSLWILGSPAPIVRVQTLPTPAGATARGAVAEWERSPEPTHRDALLRQRGCERVLDGEALLALGLPRPLFQAEAGYGFGVASADFGLATPGASAKPSLLRWPGTAAAWPTSVHDLRIAPTLASSLGLAGLSWQDSALD